MKKTLFQSNYQILNPPSSAIIETEINNNILLNHTTIVTNYLDSCPPNKILNEQPPQIHPSEETLTRKYRTTLAQLRTNKSPMLISYKNKIDQTTYPSPLCPLCNTITHDTTHLFNCYKIPTNLNTHDLWTSPCQVTELLDTWWENLDSVTLED